MGSAATDAGVVADADTIGDTATGEASPVSGPRPDADVGGMATAVGRFSSGQGPMPGFP
ncbi:MAG: hypothetical protein ACOYMG_16485 [Candidatus Methylumidiphilus sp.]